MKKEYIKPEIEVIEFEVEDILVTSGTGLFGGNFAGDEDIDIW